MMRDDVIETRFSLVDMGGPHPGPPPGYVERDFPLYDECDHVRLRYVWRVVGKAKLYGYQCLACGDPIRQSFLGAKRAAEERNDIICEAVPYEDEFTETARTRKSIYFNERRESRKAGWWDWYSAYLDSAAWKKTRRLALERDNYTCVCGSPATQVHHRTYDRVGYEKLEDLISVCVPCHAKHHGCEE